MAYDRTTVLIRERSLLDLLDLAVVVVRRWPVTLACWLLVGVVPFAAINELLGRTEALREVYVDAILLPWIEAPLATAPLTVVLGGLMFAEKASQRRVAGTLARSLFPMFLYQVVVRGVMMITGLGCLLIPSRMAFVNEVILLERGSSRSVMKRSGYLCGQQGAEFFFQWLVQILFGTGFVVIFWIGTSVLVNALVGTELTWDEPGWNDLRGFPFQLSYWLAIGFFAVVRFLTYIDQRTRLEGWEVALRLRSVGESLEESRRW